MAQIFYKTGDFITGPEPCKLHSCNAQGVFGRGAALAVKENLPWAFHVYRNAYLINGLSLGDIIWAYNINSINPTIVGNMITQEHWHPRYSINGRNTDYEAVRQCLRKVTDFVIQTQTGTIEIPGITPITEVAMPKIGSGLGGGDWNIIADIIEKESEDYYIPIVYVLPNS
jgi:O-acetyl-ADP-ribose deacetylase (regulator of RNase III)